MGSDTYIAWDTKNVTSMSEMFSGVTNFNKDIGSWDVSNVTNMSYMLTDLSEFNHDLEWEVGNNTNLTNIFSGMTAFNNNTTRNQDPGFSTTTPTWHF